ncbi:MAG TPA: hypothetical protein VGD37_25980 [Kofleriaceae bacterium]
MLDGPSPLLGRANVRLYALFRELFNAFVRDPAPLEASTRANVRAFDEALEHGWSVLGLLSQACYHWFDVSERAERLLDSVIRYWAEVDAAGPRYTRGAQNGESLWRLPHLLKYVLAHRGVPQSRLVEPLPPGGIAALLPAKISLVAITQ